MNRITLAIIGILLALTAYFGLSLWAANKARARDAVQPAKDAAAAADVAAAHAKAQVETATAQLAGRIVRVDRVLHDTVRVPERVLHPTTPADTAAAVAALPVVQQKYDACREELFGLRTDCLEYRATAEARFRADSTALAKRDTVIRTQDKVIAAGLPMRRWNVNVTLGYGGTATKDSTGAVRVRTGPSATVGLGYRLF